MKGREVAATVQTQLVEHRPGGTRSQWRKVKVGVRRIKDGNRVPSGGEGGIWEDGGRGKS